MAFKMNTFFMLCIVVAMVAIASNAFEIREKRDVPQQTKTAQQTLDEMLEQLKTNLNDLSTKIKDNDMIKNMTSTIAEFTNKISEKANDFMKTETKQ